MDALHAWGVDPHFAERAWGRRRLDVGTVELEADDLRGAAARGSLIEVGANGDQHQVEDLTQNAILIEARHVCQRALDALPDRLRRVSALRYGERPLRVQAHMKELDEIARQAGMAGQGVGEIAQAKR